jgi:hypothetical protein
MAFLYPFSQRTAERLRAMPGEGGTHRWLAQVASGLRHLLTADACFKFLRRCCDEAVAHRTVPDAEIAAAVDFAYSGQQVAKANFGRSPVDWPKPNPALIARVFAETAPAFDADADTDLDPADVLPSLFRPGELVCSGRTNDRASVRPLEDTIADAAWLQFVVVNPMRGREAVNYEGKRSVRCQNNTGIRRHLVAEFDDRTLSKSQQAQLIGRLATFVPLVMVVDSGGQSLHAWFRVDHMPARDQVRFFYVACLLGADPSRWDICGWLRMPGGLRVIEGVPTIRQRILHFNPTCTCG